MSKVCINLLLVLSLFYGVSGQTSADSLRRELELTQVDTARALLHAQLSMAYVFSKPDSGFYYASEGLRLSRKINFENGIASNLFQLSAYFRITGASYQAMQYATDALSIFKAINNHEGVIFCTNMLAWLAQDQKDYRMAIEYAFEAMRLSEKHKNYWIKYSYSSLGESYEHLNRLDSALLYAEKAEAIPESYTWNLIVLGRIHLRMNNDSLSLKHYRKAAAENTLSKDSSDIYLGMAKVFSKERQTDSAIHYSKEALQIATAGNFLFEVQQASEMLAEIYKSKYQGDSTLRYMQLSTDAKDSLFSQEKMKQFQSFAFNEKLRQQEMESDKMQYRSRIRTNVLLILIGCFLILAVMLYRNNKQKQKAKIKIEKAYDNLKSTQQQLIQSEKMASLGELTAGIAHEIQNPLNFVNNFSEVNKELLAEMNDEIDKGNLEEVKAISKSVFDNEEKISHHGKRADAIVKGMLQHSRSSSGQKESTDINALADEYLRLAYHGLRAKDKLFNATLNTDFDKTIGSINIIPQDIGRVILNLINNAFYAVDEKKKQQPSGYEPTVSVSTKKTGDKVLISVKDNGNGIPQKVLDKIFQPFFTTKPTGQGTGLGLSLSYDIVKAHGGELKVETKEGEGSEFIIQLPNS
jgi:signal transduction histidine kinase